MFKARHKTFHSLAGLIWLAVGFSLMWVGIRYLIDAAKGVAASSSLLGFLSPVTGGREQAACILIALGLFIGYLKVRYVLQKVVHRLSSKILTLPQPAHAKLVFGFRYFALVIAMMGIGLLMKVLDLPADIRGFIDVAVGSALISGSMLFFRIARAIPKASAAGVSR